MVSKEYEWTQEQMRFLRNTALSIVIVTVGLWLLFKSDQALSVVRDVRMLQVEHIQQTAAMATLLTEQRRLLTEQTKLLGDMLRQ